MTGNSASATAARDPNQAATTTVVMPTIHVPIDEAMKVADQGVAPFLYFRF